MTEKTEAAPAAEQGAGELRGKLVTRLAMAGLLVAVLLLCGFYLSKYAFDRPPLRGMGQQDASGAAVLVSRARPSVSFAPAADMRLSTAG